LSDAGLLLLAQPDKKLFLLELALGLSTVPIRLELQLEDVESAVETELLDTGFCHRLDRSLLQVTTTMTTVPIVNFDTSTAIRNLPDGLVLVCDVICVREQTSAWCAGALESSPCSRLTSFMFVG
jgi:hypothetical protein